MDTVISTMTVYFDEPFWVGVFERVENIITVCDSVRLWQLL